MTKTTSISATNPGPFRFTRPDSAYAMCWIPGQRIARIQIKVKGHWKPVRMVELVSHASMAPHFDKARLESLRILEGIK